MDLSRNALQGALPPDLFSQARTPGLTLLSLAHNSLTGLGSMQPLPALQVLQLHGNPLLAQVRAPGPYVCVVFLPAYPSAA